MKYSQIVLGNNDYFQENETSIMTYAINCLEFNLFSV